MPRNDAAGQKGRKRSPGPNWSQIIFTIVAVIVIATFVLSLLAK